MPDYAYLLMNGGLLAAHILFSFLYVYYPKERRQANGTKKKNENKTKSR